MVIVAYKLAKSAHRGQFRRSGAPYIEHPVQIAHIAADLSMDTTAISAALLHDVVEDTNYKLEDIKTLFGPQVAELVDGVTKLKKLQYNTHEEQQVENLRKMFLAMAKDIRVVIIKLIDRLHNMRTLKFMPRNKQLEKAKETLEVYAPLAHRLGMSKIKTELEDLSLKYLDPVAYEEIRDGIRQKKKEREEYISGIMDALTQKLDEFKIKAQVTGRAKHFYSIFRKMYGQNKTIDELYDLFAVRIIVDTVTDCYAVLGMVHEMYTPVPMRFKDYIAMPKPNMYQSLHTTVIGPNGTPFEIQIRTWEMHKIAEEGIAAHWKYKEGISGETDMDSKLEWVRQLLETQVDIIDTDDFLNTLKIDLFADEVFVFTPNGKVISLPAKSTVIDFAFAIHSAVGYKMIGAKVNGKLVNNDYTLQNGEIVEIITSSSCHGPSRDWLKIVKTSQAKNKINQWFKRERRDENIEHGKELIEKELKRLRFTHSQLFVPEWVEQILRRYSFNSLDDLYASIGYGGLTAQKVVMRLRDEYIKAQKEKNETLNIPQRLPENIKRRGANNGIIVEGIDNCLVRLAKCCNPVPGDSIKGFITKGRGVSVHRSDCPNIQPSALAEEDKNRFIGVSWIDSKSSSYITTIQVEIYDRDGILLDISSAIADLKIPCKSVNARVNKKNIAVIHLGLEISGKSDLDKVAKRLKQMQGIVNITRTSN
ncbi:MAG: bifunctional (p)ppGpp synthetase/guanosine-3',5'-bis(diphosphate) 3'-pyrophosphohydrolase [Clostridia bacterium]|nr:bifunctional (p)ppGpp synthetase/guanosine-3',5'-bis(diphosphate) 3'-pyrophosphohydrolase [Clostridia bacterium]